ncbi:hypothetical protein [Formosa sp. L2A11]|uniref:hypothetical protein n=1 Tax=Formosa sp. L2A11 TaxID=2686363 RepID=UPI00131B95E7|nr:hypothetical protein [Formosa sp. L2A11]
MLGLIIGVAIISYFKIPLETLMVDRWSVISSFLTELYNGNYPYFAKSHRGNYPGPMPIYYLIAAPFHYIGELSLLSSLGYCIVTVILIKKTTATKHLNFLIFYMFTSAYMIWEITTRSNLFTFTMLVLLVLNAFINLDNKTTLKFYGLALLTGLLLSTRSVYILPYVIFFLSSLVNQDITFKNIFLFLSIAFIAFTATFIPFIYFYPDDFFKMNPFIIQSSFLIPTAYTIVFIIIAIFLTFLVKTKTDKFFFSGLSLFIAILIYGIYYLVNYGFVTSYINSKMDISYFIFCMPFFITYLIYVNPDKKTLATH